MTTKYKLQLNERDLTISSLSEGIELSCIMTTPITKDEISKMDKYPLDSKLKLEGDPYPGTLRSVIIIHGIGGHKNYTYHSKLARKIAHEQGVTSIRFDFRNCGSSTKTGNLGRTLQDDILDCQAVYEYLHTEGYSIDALIGHSRGVVDVFNWQLQYKDLFVPNLIACAGRFIGKGLPDSIRKIHPNFEKEGGHFIKGFQDGEYRDVFVPLNETESLGELNMSTVKSITKHSSTITVYGLKEEIIPLPDAAHYAHSLGDRNTLVFIPNATHSYYGAEIIPKDKWEQSEVPVNIKLGKLDFNYQVTDVLTEWLNPESVRRRFYERNLNIHEFLPRWKVIEGVSNCRDIGGWKTNNPTWSTGKHIKWGIIFRSGSLDAVTIEGQRSIKELGIRKVFDFRFSFETKGFDFELLKDVEFVSLAVGENEGDGSKVYLDMANSWKNYDSVYEYLLDQVVPTYKQIFHHLRDSQDPILYHCSAGKDRTGILTAVILKMLGVPNEIIAAEYELTVEGMKASDEHTPASLVPFLKQLGLHEHPALDNIQDSKYEVMLETLLKLDKKYGKIENYLEVKLGLTNDDISTIRAHLLF